MRNKGLYLNPTRELDIDAYSESDSTGLCGYEDSLDPICVQSITGFVINMANFPVLWKSQLQNETATSTMEAEFIALVGCYQELMSIIDMVNFIGEAVGLSGFEKTKMHVCIHEYNAGALVLPQTIPPQFTPQSKYYAVKTHWF